MPSFSNWLTVLAAVSAPLVATAHSVIDTRAAAAGASDAVTADPFFASDASLASDEHASSALAWEAEGLPEEELGEHGRALLRQRRRRGTSRASPKVPPKKSKSSKKKSPPKKKSSKKKSPPKKKSSKKKSPGKKKSSGVAGVSRSKGSGKTIGAAKKAHGTFFSGMGSPTGGCGVPPSKAFDDRGVPLPFVALNTNSEFSSGSNCGRWIEVTLKENCEGGGNSQWSTCNGGRYVSDSMSGDKIYGYIMDSCADSNYWCQSDTYHLDISKEYLTAMGYLSNGSSQKWNGRKVEWKYMSGVPSGWSMNQPKFMWKSGSKWIANGKGFYASVIIYNTSNGIGGVQQKVGSQWVPIRPLNHLGNMWVLQRPGDAEYRRPNGGTGQCITIRVLDVDGDMYGSYSLKWMCGGSGACYTEIDAPLC